jgi:sugar phosphate isomerase/epimerase
MFDSRHGYPDWSLKDDRALRREMVAAMRDRGVSISLGEGFTVKTDIDARDRAADLEIMCELGVKRINAVSMDPDLNRTYDQYAILAEMAQAVGVEMTLEFGPGLTISNLPSAVAAVRHVARPNFRLLIDTMHFARSGSDIAELAALDPNMIGYAQLSDAPRISKYSSYMEEALFERRVPGTGELPLSGILAALPRHLVLGLEVPERSRALAGVGPHERLGSCVEGARSLLAGLHGHYRRPG